MTFLEQLARIVKWGDIEGFEARQVPSGKMRSIIQGWVVHKGDHSAARLSNAPI